MKTQVNIASNSPASKKILEMKERKDKLISLIKSGEYSKLKSSAKRLN